MISVLTQDPTALLEEARRLMLEVGADTDVLYRRWFHQETGRTIAWPSDAAYRAAVLDPERFETGWRAVRRVDGLAGAVLAVREGRERLVAPPEIAPNDVRCLAPDRGAALRVDPLASGQAGGFWHLWSAGWQAATPERLQRLYVHVAPHHSLDFAAQVAAKAPTRSAWAMKALCGTHDSGRRDCVVLYLPAGTDFESGWVARLLLAAEGICAAGLPPFVEPLGSGLGKAPDPGGGRSFGEALCAAVASAAGQVGDATQFAAAAIAAIRTVPGVDRGTAP
jgi:hypothetical protein